MKLINGYGLASVLREMAKEERIKANKLGWDSHKVKTLEQLRDFSIDVGMKYGLAVGYENAAKIIDEMVKS